MTSDQIAQMPPRAISCFKAYDVRGRLGSELDEDVAYRIGRAFAQERNAETVIVGRDSRATSPALAEALIRGLTEGGADLLWIETDTPNVTEIGSMVAEIRKVVPNAKLTYNNSPSFNWTLNLRKQVRAQWLAEGRIKPADFPDGNELMRADYDATDLGHEADARLQRFQTDIAARAGVFHNLITLPTFHLTAKSVDELSRGYFGEDKMLAYVKTVQREEIRRGISAVKHQHEVGSDLGDTFKEMVAGDRALKAGGHANTMNQFAAE
jgi:isocitrate lyase